MYQGRILVDGRCYQAHGEQCVAAPSDTGGERLIEIEPFKAEINGLGTLQSGCKSEEPDGQTEALETSA
jgi:hypothetical protein